MQLKEGLRSATALADDPPALTFGAAAPDAFLLADRERMLETRCAHGALSADILGWLSLLVRGGVEDHGVEAATGSVLAPGLLHGGGMAFLVDGRGSAGARPRAKRQRRTGSLTFRRGTAQTHVWGPPP